MKKRKGRYTLLEALNILEATVSRGYPNDGTGVAGDDDRPPGNIVYGEKYKKTPYYNKLTTFQKSWEVDLGDWTWDEFENTKGMEDLDNYSNTLINMKNLFPKNTWKNIWSKMKHVPDEVATRRFKQAGQPWRRGGKGQLGIDKEDNVRVDKVNVNKTKNEELVKKIKEFIL